MRTLLIAIAVFIFCTLRLNAQESGLNDTGSDVINFLLSCPDSANTVNTIDSVALDLIGWMLCINCETVHELLFYDKSSKKLLIPNRENRQAELHQDPTTGKLYLILDNRIYPVSEGLRLQALKNSRAMVPDDHLAPYDPDELVKTLKGDHKRDEICMIFSCNQAGEVKDDMDLETDFHNLKRSFHIDEEVYVVINYHMDLTDDESNLFLTFRLCDEYENQVFYVYTATLSKENNYFWWRIYNHQPGRYVIHAILSDKINDDIPLGPRHKVERVEVFYQE